jgi:hypothetical protein
VLTVTTLRIRLRAATFEPRVAGPEEGLIDRRWKRAEPRARHMLYIPDLTNNQIWFLNRSDGKILGQMGSMGQNGGQFFGLHMEAVDSKGMIYMGEVFAGERVQRFVPVQ